MFKREEKIVRVGTVGDFMKREHHKKAQVKKEHNRANKFAASGALLPLGVAIPSVFASAKSTFAASPETVINVGAEQGMKCMDYVAAATVNASNAVPAGAIEYGSEKLLQGLAHLFDPLIDLIVSISFPVASALIAFKLFMGFFVDQGQVWEGIGRISIVYVLIQMLPIFTGILKQMGNLV
jgi:hypothetical protein